MFHFEAANLGHVDSIKSFADGESGAALLAATILMQAVSGDADSFVRFAKGLAAKTGRGVILVNMWPEGDFCPETH